MVTKAPSDATLAFSHKLRAFLDQPWPPAHIDRAAHDHRLHALQVLIAEWGGVSDTRGSVHTIRLNGFKATSTVSLARACRNWITQVTLKAGQAAMAGVR